MNILGRGIYSLSEAARLTQLKPSRVREWIIGRPTLASRKPVFHTDYRSIDATHAISFHDLIELFVAGQLRNHRVSLQSLRKVHAQLARELGTRHPFCRSELLTDGKRVFTLGLDEDHQQQMIEVLTHQRVFAKVLLPFLERIDYDQASSLALRWCITRGVLVDPTINLGKPVIEDIGISTAILASAYEANARNADLVAEWYKVHVRHVLAAVDFERSLAA